jgi:hypothetical protein
MAGELPPEEIARLSAAVERLVVDGDVHVVACDVARHRDADLRLIEAIARMALVAKRHDRRIRLRHASPEVRAFVALLGLAEVLPCETGPGAPSVEVRR